MLGQTSLASHFCMFELDSTKIIICHQSEFTQDLLVIAVSNAINSNHGYDGVLRVSYLIRYAITIYFYVGQPLPYKSGL